MCGGGDGCAALSAVPGCANALLPWLMMLAAGPMLAAGLPWRSWPAPLDRASGGVLCFDCNPGTMAVLQLHPCTEVRLLSIGNFSDTFELPPDLVQGADAGAGPPAAGRERGRGADHAALLRQHAVRHLHAAAHL